MQSELLLPRAVCFSGHRPEKFPFDTSVKLYRDMFCSLLYLHSSEAIQDGYHTFYCGMQRGVDIWAGQQILKLKARHPEIRLICVSPYEQEIRSRHGSDLRDYEELRDSCDEFVSLSREYHRNCYTDRNRYMVDRSGYLICALSDYKSGTSQTLAYAKKRGLKFHTIDLNSFAEQYGLKPNHILK